MNLLKSTIFALSDPIVQIFILSLFVFIFHSLRKWSKYLSYSEQLSVLMVTSGYHMRRVLSITDGQKINLDYYSVGKVSYNTLFDDFIISTKWLSKSKHLFYEMIAYVGYLITGRL